MAVPSNAQVRRGFALKSGVILGVSPSSDPTFDVEIARSSTGAYTTIARLTGKGEGVPVSYTDILPMDGSARSYKARAVKDGWLAGDYTAVIEVKPVILPEIAPNITPLTGKAIGTPLFVSTGAATKFGSKQATRAFAKEVRIYPFQFWSTNNAVATRQDDQYLYALTTGAKSYRATFPMPPGAFLGAIDWLGRRMSTNGSLRFRVRQRVSPTIIFDIVDYTATGTGQISVTTTGFTSTASTSAYGAFPDYFIQVDMTSTAGSTASTLFQYAEVNYFIPTVAQK